MVSAARLKAYALVLGVFLLGAVAGGALSYAWAQDQALALFSGDREAFEQNKLRAMARELDLDEAQTAKVRAIFEKHRRERQELGKAMFETCGQPMKALKAKIDSEVKAVLTPEQQKRFDELKAPGPPRG